MSSVMWISIKHEKERSFHLADSFILFFAEAAWNSMATMRNKSSHRLPIVLATFTYSNEKIIDL